MPTQRKQPCLQRRRPRGPADIDDTGKNGRTGSGWTSAGRISQCKRNKSQTTHEKSGQSSLATTKRRSEGLLAQMVTTNLEDDRLQFENKRPASQELNETMDAKRVKLESDDASEQDIQEPAAPFSIPFPEKPAVLEERAGDIEYRVVNNDGSRESIIILTGLKCLFQKQLPKMPKDYIARLVYDRSHLSMAIVKHPLQVIGGVCYRAFRRRQFAEIVFCAVASDQQVKGYGAHLMAHLKDYVRTATTPPIMHLLTYADNYATGYFQKQGFSKDVTLERALWAGCIKDYEGGTLMQCSMLPRVRYLEAGRMLLKQREAVLAKIRPSSRSHVVHPPPAQWAAAGVVTPIDPLSVPAIRATGWCPAMDEMGRAPRHGPHFTEMRRFLGLMQNHKQAWPFLAPVSRDDVPDYHTVIQEPMDLATMEERLNGDAYAGPKEMVRDMRLIFANCRVYNDASTVYSKCAVKLERYMWSLVKEVPEWHALLDDEGK